VGIIIIITIIIIIIIVITTTTTTSIIIILIILSHIIIISIAEVGLFGRALLCSRCIAIGLCFGWFLRYCSRFASVSSSSSLYAREFSDDWQLPRQRRAAYPPPQPICVCVPFRARRTTSGCSRA
jgi:hypothetical protein